VASGKQAVRPLLCVPVLGLILLGACSKRSSGGPDLAQLATRSPGVAFRITLGAADAEPATWDGSIELASGRLLSLAGWRFYKDDQLGPDGKSWKCSTRRRAMPDPRDWYVGARHVVPPDPAAPPPPGPMVPNGVLVTLDAPARAEVRVSTANGNFSFVPENVPFGKPSSFLNGRVLVERTAAAWNLTRQDGAEDDNPSVAIDSNGRAWAAWIAYVQGQDQVFAAPLGQPPAAVGKPGVHFRTALARHGGDLWLVTASREGEVWNLAGARFDGRSWSGFDPLTATTGPKMFHRLALDSAGRLWLVWQGWAQGRSEIHAKFYDGNLWSETRTVSANTANAWEPSIAADAQGRVHFAWDAYDNGSYNIYLRTFDGKQFGPPQAVTSSPRFHAHASVECDALGRPWVAWEEAGPNWGKDTGFLVRQNAGQGLYEQREVRVAVFDQGRWMAPPPPAAGDFTEQPLLVRDKAGHMWCFFRRRSVQMEEVYSPSLQRNRLQPYSHWEYFGAAFDGERWSAPVELPHSAGRNDFRLAVAAAANNQIVAAWAADGRTWAKPYPFVKNNIFAGWLGVAGSPQPARLGTHLEPAAAAAAVHPREAQQLEAIRKARILAGGRRYRIVRGDMHRHTDLSFDGDLDGSVWDFYRYSIDAAGFEYSALTDHNSGDDNEYFWWIIQKSSDLFYVPDRFTPLYAYERSLRFPNGHRNILFARRGIRTLPRSKEEESGAEGAGRLYQYLKQNGGLAMSHTSGTLMGTDWRDNDPALEPLVEIYQGDRTSYEYDGAPRAARGADKLSQPGGFAPQGWVWNAWAKGYKLGVQASSDHFSTHISYACLLVENTSRDGLLDAVRRRRAYAATDNIILDFRLTEISTGDHLMGESFTSSGRPRIVCRAAGTAPIARIDLIKNNKFLYSVTPGKDTAEFTYEDKDAAKGESYYYVRLEQTDGQMAWSSPVWVKMD